MKESVLREKSYRFAIRIVKLSQYLIDKKNAWVLSKQVLRSGTVIEALVRESEHAESPADFGHKLIRQRNPDTLPDRSIYGKIKSYGF